MSIRFPTQDEADWVNASQFNLLSSPIETFQSIDSSPTSTHLHRSMTPTSTLCLRIGTQVLFIRHVAPHIANGTLGKVVGFAKKFKHQLTNSSPTGTQTCWPIVRLLGSQPDIITVLVEPYTFTTTIDGMTLTTRTQVHFSSSISRYWYHYKSRFLSCLGGLRSYQLALPTWSELFGQYKTLCFKDAATSFRIRKMDYVNTHIHHHCHHHHHHPSIP